MAQVFSEYRIVLAWVSGISLFFFVASLAAVPWLIARMPATYFRDLAEEKISPGGGTGRTLYGPVARGVLNLSGFFLVAAGVVMLFIPGQGVLTILAGLILIDFPGKGRLVICIVRNQGIQKGLNWIRQKKGISPFVFP